MVYQRILFLSLFTLFLVQAQAQLQNSHWTFGYNCWVDFSGGVPVGNGASAIYSNEQCATVSNEVTGQLLFYSDGQSVWNANHTVMPNGLNLFGGAYCPVRKGH